MCRFGQVETGQAIAHIAGAVLQMMSELLYSFGLRFFV
jgi:hypothetical protein